MIFKLKREIREAFISLLRQSFATNADYTWVDNYRQTKILIPEHWPMKYVKYPTVVVTAVPSGDLLKRTLQYEYQETVHGPVSIDGSCVEGDIAERYGGGFELNVNIDAADLSHIVAEDVLDWVVMYVRWIARDVLAASGIEVTGISQAGERTQLIGNDQVFINGITVKVYSEWFEEIPIAVSETLKGICLEGVCVY